MSCRLQLAASGPFLVEEAMSAPRGLGMGEVGARWGRGGSAGERRSGSGRGSRAEGVSGESRFVGPAWPAHVSSTGSKSQMPIASPEEKRDATSGGRRSSLAPLAWPLWLETVEKRLITLQPGGASRPAVSARPVARSTQSAAGPTRSVAEVASLALSQRSKAPDSRVVAVGSPALGAPSPLRSAKTVQPER